MWKKWRRYDILYKLIWKTCIASWLHLGQLCPWVKINVKWINVIFNLTSISIICLYTFKISSKVNIISEIKVKSKVWRNQFSVCCKCFCGLGVTQMVRPRLKDFFVLSIQICKTNFDLPCMSYVPIFVYVFRWNVQNRKAATIYLKLIWSQEPTFQAGNFVESDSSREVNSYLCGNIWRNAQ